MMVFALDVGDVRIGIARTDELGMTAQPLGVRVRTTLPEDLAYFCGLVKDWKAERIIVGLPLKMDGTDSPQTQKVRDFTAELAKSVPIPVEFSDERCTTAAAEEILREGRVRPKKRKAVVDVMAAQIILQDWLSESARKRAASDTNR